MRVDGSNKTFHDKHEFNVAESSSNMVTTSSEFNIHLIGKTALHKQPLVMPKCVCVYTYIYIYMYVFVCVYINREL